MDEVRRVTGTYGDIFRGAPAKVAVDQELDIRLGKLLDEAVAFCRDQFLHDQFRSIRIVSNHGHGHAGRFLFCCRVIRQENIHLCNIKLSFFKRKITCSHLPCCWDAGIADTHSYSTALALIIYLSMR